MNRLIIPIQHCNKISSAKCLRYKIPKLLSLNHLTLDAINKIKTHSLEGFVNYSKQIIINRYNSICDIVNCYICSLDN